MKVVLLGVFGLIGVIVFKFGLVFLILLGKLVIIVYCVMIFFVFVVFGFVVKLLGISILLFIKILKDEIILVYIIVSFEVVLLKLMEKMEKFGCLKVIMLFVILIGYLFNLDGFILY